MSSKIRLLLTVIDLHHPFVMSMNFKYQFKFWDFTLDAYIGWTCLFLIIIGMTQNIVIVTTLKFIRIIKVDSNVHKCLPSLQSTLLLEYLLKVREGFLIMENSWNCVILLKIMISWRELWKTEYSKTRDHLFGLLHIKSKTGPKCLYTYYLAVGIK